MSALTRLVTKIFRKEDVSQPGLGTFLGVYLPGVLSMFGVIIYLRLAWIVGTFGLLQTTAVVFLSCLIVFITVLSIASLATNRPVGGGGTYFIVSRSLGIEIGSAVGMALLIAQALTISFCAMGFAESVQPLLPQVPLCYIAASSLLLLMGLVFSSASVAIKSQTIIFALILASLASLFFGHPLVEEPVEITFDTFSSPFWAAFALFFPATTGIETGVSMSGNLRNPRRSLPLGSLAVLLTGFLIYVFLPFFLWNRAPRSLLVGDTLIVQHLSRFQFLITAGIWAATLSSMLSGLLAAPQTLKALAGDGVFPRFLANESGKAKQPRWALLLCFAIALTGIFYGSINKIAPILTMFYLIAYATLNLATGLEELLGNPSWRPTFRVHWMVSFLGVLLCLLAMFMINAGYTFIALFFVIALYVYMKKRNFSKKWEDIREGLLVFLSRFAIYKLAHVVPSARAWRPNFLVFSSNPIEINHLVDITASVCRGKGFLTLASVFSPSIVDHERSLRWKKIVSAHLKENRIEALVEFCQDENLLSGAKQLLMNYGMGSLSPNTLVLGEIKNRESGKEYFGIIQAATAVKKNVLIIRDSKAHVGLKNKIHIWWDDHSRANSELMLLLGHMLQTNRTYRNSSLYLHSIVTQEHAKAQRESYFQEFFAKGRLKITPKVHVKEPFGSSFEMMQFFSAQAQMVFIGMQDPKTMKSPEEFEEYYYKLMESTAGIPHAIFVICCEEIDYKSIFD